MSITTNARKLKIGFTSMVHFQSIERFYLHKSSDYPSQKMCPSVHTASSANCLQCYENQTISISETTALM